MESSSRKIHRQALETFIAELFEAMGLDQEQSALIARHLVFANLRGVESHGVSRVDIYSRRLEAGLVSKKAIITIMRETAASAFLHGGNASGIVLATKGMQLAVEKAKQAGIGIVGIAHSNHCGMLADYTLYAAEQDCIAIAMTNAPAMIAPWGGREKFLGTNPLSYGIPAGNEDPIVFDMATSQVSRGKIILAEKNNQKIPLGWAISKDGKPTTDPKEALEGVLLPVGGPKGYGINFLIEVLSSLLSGAAFGPHIGDIYGDFQSPQNTGQCFIVMRADLFRDLQVFKKEMDQLIREIRQVPLMEGYDRIYLPGEIEMECARERELSGIPLSRGIIEELMNVAQRYGVPSSILYE